MRPEAVSRKAVAIGEVEICVRARVRVATGASGGAREAGVDELGIRWASGSDWHAGGTPGSGTVPGFGDASCKGVTPGDCTRDGVPVGRGVVYWWIMHWRA